MRRAPSRTCTSGGPCSRKASAITAPPCTTSARRATWPGGRRCNARTPELRALPGLAESSLRLGRHAEAAGFAEAARESASRSGNGLFHAKALILLAELDLNGGEFEAAASRAGQAVDLQPEAGHRAGRADALVVLGHARRGAGDEKGALRCWTDALDLYQALGAGRAEELRALMVR